MIGIGIGIASPVLRSSRWSPSGLFYDSQGLAFDPSRLWTLFQDAAGTIPANAPGQPVGLIRDLSGRGNHASQSVALSRPILARHPASGLRQMLIYSGDITNAAWTKTNVTVSSDNVDGRDCWRITENSVTGTHRISQSVSIETGLTYVSAALVHRDTRSIARIESFRGTNGAVADFDLTTVSLISSTNIVGYGCTDVGDGWVECWISWTATATTASPMYLYFLPPASGNSWAGNGVSGGLFAYAQVEAGTAPTPYQAASAAYDVSEAGYSSIWGLKFDGIDDYLTTPTINWGRDEMEVIYAARKPGDTAAGVLAEYGASSSDGSWSVVYPGAPGATWDRYGRAFSRGTLNVGAGIGSALTQYAGPLTIVGGYRAKISTDTLIPRVNGVDLPGAAADHGSGNYASRALTIGRASGGGSPFAGTIYGLMVINRLLTPTERSRAERYWGWIGLSPPDGVIALASPENEIWVTPDGFALAVEA